MALLRINGTDQPILQARQDLVGQMRNEPNGGSRAPPMAASGNHFWLSAMVAAV
jgi:hypothetical protein